MKKKGKGFFSDEMDLPLPSSSDLRGRQSVRATFKLSSRAIETMSIVSVHLGIKQKSLFDHLIEDMQSLSLIAREMESEKFSAPDRVQKTFVVSRKTLSSLEQVCRRYNAPRDALVEFSIQRLLPVIEKEREKHRNRKQILQDIKQHLAEGLEILAKSKTLLGEDDPVYARLEAAMANYLNTKRNIEHYVERGSIIEDF